MIPRSAADARAARIELAARSRAVDFQARVNLAMTASGLGEADARRALAKVSPEALRQRYRVTPAEQIAAARRLGKPIRRRQP